MKKHIWILIIFFTSVLLIANEDYSMFISNMTKTFTTIGYEKAKGINMTFKYPDTWTIKDGERANTLCYINKVLEKGKSLTTLVIIKDIPKELSTFSDMEIAEALFSKDYIETFIPEGMIYIDSGTTKYDGQPGAWLEYKGLQSRAGVEVQMHTLTHMFIYNNKLVGVGFGLGGLPEDVTVLSSYNDYKPLFTRIGLSIILPDKWKD